MCVNYIRKSKKDRKENCVFLQWKFLLGFYEWDSTAEERNRVRSEKVAEYHRMRSQWRSISVEQEERFSAFKERKTQIEKDVSRTDRTHPFFAGDGNKNIELLQDILMTYIMYNFDLGYVQGMSDLLSPILYVMENEVDAFWCFVGFMKLVKRNFDFDQGGIKAQLSQIVDLLKTLDSDLYAYLDAKDSGNLYFCFRWLLIWFKREFAFTDVMRLWEVIWTGLPCENFHLLVCFTLIEIEKPSIVENQFGFSEILKHVNDLSYRIHLNTVLMKAEAVWRKLKEEHNSEHMCPLSNAGRRVLGMSELTEQDLNHQSGAARMNRLSTNKNNQPNYSTTSSKTHTQINGPKISKSKPMVIVDGVGRTRGEVHRPSAEMRSHPVHHCTTPHDNLAVNGHHRLSSNHTNESSSEPNSLNESSSVEVLSEIDDEAKFENSLATFNQFEN